MIARKRGILVVDDEDGARTVLGAYMRHQGYAVWLADGGQQAIGLFRRHGNAIDVVFMDVHMADLDGPRTLAALRKLNPHVRCCFMSGNTGAYTEEELRGMSDAAVLRKPFRLMEIPLMLWELAAPVDRVTAMQDDRWRDDGGQGRSDDFAELNPS